MLVARISLTLSRHLSLSFIASGRSSGQHPVSSHSCWMYDRAGRPAFARPCVGVHKSTSLMSSSLLSLIIYFHAVKWLEILLFNANIFYSIIFIHLQSNSSKYCYVMPIIQYLHTVNLFQLFHWSRFICTQLNSSKYCYVTLIIYFDISPLFAYCLNVKEFNLTHRSDRNK